MTKQDNLLIKKNPHLGTQLEAESYTKQEAIEFLQNGLGIPTNDSAFLKREWIVRILSGVSRWYYSENDGKGSNVPRKLSDK